MFTRQLKINNAPRTWGMQSNIPLVYFTFSIKFMSEKNVHKIVTIISFLGLQYTYFGVVNASESYCSLTGINLFRVANLGQIQLASNALFDSSEMNI